ncbi:MAG: hypothetical protein LBT40_12555 [Deltaproteobacteria bacterium]|jgi:hypothetical protein|nr:hypothetical protein [Deltaproteobacteria bacterium]
MFKRTVPADLSIFRSDLADFCEESGFEKVLVDTVTMKQPRNNNTAIYTPGSGYFMFSAMDDNVSIADGTQYEGHRMVVKDPAGDCYIHLIFYSYNYSVSRYGNGELHGYMDGYLSTGWTVGAVDSHPGICKMTVWRSLPLTFNGLDMYSGTTSEGRLWVHVAVEERPLLFNHMGFGSMEKSLDFTGGDFIAPNSKCFIPPAGAAQTSVNIFGAYAGYSHNSGSTSLASFWPSGFYCPDLDMDGKVSPDNLYRMMCGNNVTRPGMERGCTSLRLTFNSSTVTPANGQGGELSSMNMPMPNPWSGTAPLLPIYVYASDGTDIRYKGQAGYFAGVRATKVDSYYPKDEIVLGPDTWVTYPASAKVGIVPDIYQCYNQGYAVLKNG